MNNNNYIIVDGEKISENEIPHFYPLSIVKYQNSYNTIIRFIVEEIYQISKSSKKYPVYVNLLASKSLKVKYLAIILETSKSHKIEEISLDYLPTKFASFFNIPLKGTQKNLDFIDKGERLATIPKYIANLIFSVLGVFFKKKKGSNPESLVRAWVDIDEKLHKDEFYKSMVFIYPFGINFKRSITFIKRVFKNHNNVCLKGVRYSALYMLKTLFSQQLIHALVNFEYNGMKAHSKTLLKYKTVYTSDEFQIASPILYGNEKSPFVVNKAHGMGCYNLEINYDEFHLFNKVQKDFYFKNNPSIKYKTYGSICKNEITEKKGDKNFVYIDQGDLTKYNYFYESKLQSKIIESLKSIKKMGATNVFIKYHPNRSEKEKKDFYNLHGLNPIDRFNIKEDYVFINLYSTSYFDFKKFGTFLFVNDNSFCANYFFGDEIDSVHVDKLKNTLLSYEN
tara:strand:- start:210 stop:1562 length:1353 start_codon:yes stop_codon:yes gene_type:complete